MPALEGYRAKIKIRTRRLTGITSPADPLVAYQ